MRIEANQLLRRRVLSLVGLPAGWVSLLGGLTVCALHQSSLGAAGDVHTTVGTKDWNDPASWSPATVPNGAGEIVGTTGAATTTLNTSVIVGAMRLSTSANWLIQASGGNTLTMDGSGLTSGTSPLGVANEATISVQVNTNTLSIQPNILMASHLRLGSNGFGNANGSVSLSGSITNTSNSTKNLTLQAARNNVTISGNIGMSGDDIVILNQGVTGGVGTNTTLSGNLGSKVTSVTQNNSQTSSNGTPNTLVLSGDNSAFTGAVNLQAGVLDLRHANALGATVGAGTFTISAGTRLTNGLGNSQTLTLLSTGNQVWNGNFSYNASNAGLNLGTGAVSLTTNVAISVTNSGLTVGGAISGNNFGITKSAASSSINNLTLTGSSTFTGGITVGTALTPHMTARTLSVSGANGSVNGATSVTIVGNDGAGIGASTFELSNLTSSIERLNDSATVSTSLGGEFRLTSSPTASSTETIGGLAIGAGNSTINLSAASNQSANVLHQLLVGSAGFSRSDRGTATIAGRRLGTAAANGGSRIVIDGIDGTNLTFGGSTVISSSGAGGGTTKNLRIVPYLLGASTDSSTTTNRFVTYDKHATSGGLRLLTSSEMDTLTSTYADVGNNVVFNPGSGTSISFNAGSRTFNSLTLGANVTALNANTSADSLTINSGALLTSGATNFNSFNKVTFGNGEAVVFSTASTLTINSPIDVTTNGGLTKAGAGALVIGATALYSGSTIVNQGTLRIGNGTSGNLASGSGAITLQTHSTLSINMGASDTLANDIVNNGAISRTLGTSVNTLSGDISGSGSVSQTSVGSTLILSGSNTYSGATSAGTNTTLIINGNQSAATGAVTVSAGATLGGSGTVGGATTLNGILSPGNSPGTLTFNSNLTMTNGSSLTFEAGDLVDVNGTLDLDDNWTLRPTTGFQNGGTTTLFTYTTLATSPDLIPTFDISGLGFTPSGSLFLTNTGSAIVLNGISATPDAFVSLASTAEGTNVGTVAVTAAPGSGKYLPGYLDVADTENGHVTITGFNPAGDAPVLVALDVEGASDAKNSLLAQLIEGQAEGDYTIVSLSSIPGWLEYASALNGGSTTDWEFLISFASNPGSPRSFNFDFGGDVTLDRLAVIPEPTSLALAGVAMTGLLGRRRRRR